jgi:hypothetical protein
VILSPVNLEQCIEQLLTSSLRSNNRRLDNKFNIFEGISRNWFFIGVNIITICGQVIIVFVGSSALSTVRLDRTQWAISVTKQSSPTTVSSRTLPCRMSAISSSFIKIFVEASIFPVQETWCSKI